MRKKPRFASVDEFAEGLGLSGQVARALCGRLSEHDLPEIRSRIAGEMAIRQKHRLKNSDLASRKFQEAWRSWSDEQRRDVCAEFILAECGLSDEPTNPLLIGELAHTVERLKDNGFDLSAFIGDAGQINTSKREAISWFLMLRESAGLSNSDEGAIGRILGPYVAGLPSLDLESWDAENAARNAAKDAYRSTYGALISKTKGIKQ